MTRNLAVTNIVLERERGKKKKKEFLQHGAFEFVTAPGTPPNMAYFVERKRRSRDALADYNFKLGASLFIDDPFSKLSGS